MSNMFSGIANATSNTIPSLNSIINLASTISSTSTSPFTNNGMVGINSMDKMSTGQYILFLLILFFLLYLTMWIGAFVFNTSVVKIFPSTKKVTALDFFGLYIVIHLLFC
jgi:hypothetical protein